MHASEKGKDNQCLYFQLQKNDFIIWVKTISNVYINSADFIVSALPANILAENGYLIPLRAHQVSYFFPK